jgi:hypothetical protein
MKQKAAITEKALDESVTQQYPDSVHEVRFVYRLLKRLFCLSSKLLTSLSISLFWCLAFHVSRALFSLLRLVPVCLFFCLFCFVDLSLSPSVPVLLQ